MWTYLLILFSLGLILGVFIRKFVLLQKRGPEVKIKIEEEAVKDGEAREKVSTSDLKEVESLCRRAEALLKSGKDEEAIKCLVQALVIDEKNLTAQEKLAMLYLQKEMFGAAAALFRQLGELTDDAVHYSHLGLALYQQSDFPGARDAYQKAVILDDSRPRRFVSLAQVYRSLGQSYHAMMALNKALEIDEHNFDFLFLLANLYVDLGDLEKAATIANELAETYPENNEVKELLKDIKRLRTETV